MKKIAILGYGLEGKSLFTYLKKDKNNQITILDKKYGKNYLDNLNQFDIIYRSPGVPYNFPEVQKVKKKVSSLTKLFFEEAEKRGATIVGITGSVGKTTTATLLYKILKAGKKDACLVGNIGINPLAYLKKLSRKSKVVMELSSFQLQDLDRSPKIAVVLDIYEEHLDKHKTFREYLSAKSNIAKHQAKSDILIYSADNKYSSAIAKTSPAKKVKISILDGLKKKYKLKTLGDHNFKNSLAAEKVASLFGVPEKISREVIESFRGLEHRIEFVRNLKGVKYFNNSKATNIASAIAGTDSFSKPKIVLIGGHDKNLDLVPLVKRLLSWDIKLAIFYGETAKKLAQISKDLSFSRLSAAKGLKEALLQAYKISESGDLILLSPGTSSFDEFENYEERGKKFKEWVRKLK